MWTCVNTVDQIVYLYTLVHVHESLRIGVLATLLHIFSASQTFQRVQIDLTTNLSKSKRFENNLQKITPKASENFKVIPNNPTLPNNSKKSKTSEPKLKKTAKMMSSPMINTHGVKHDQVSIIKYHHPMLSSDSFMAFPPQSNKEKSWAKAL